MIHPIYFLTINIIKAYKTKSLVYDKLCIIKIRIFKDYLFSIKHFIYSLLLSLRDGTV